METENVNLETGEVVCPETDIDMMITKLEIIKTEEASLRDQRINLELQLAQIARSIASEEKTRRVAGKERVVKVEFKTTERWDQKKLNQIREEIGHEAFSTFFRKDEWVPNKMELKKLRSTAGETEKLYYLIAGALLEQQGKPQVTIEK